jgi:Zn-dependent protease
MTEIIVGVLVLIVSVVVHEAAHAWTASWFGDPTAKMMGRLSLNPAVHLDPFGSVLLPLLLILTGSPVLLGYAKPVPVRSEYFARPLRDMMWVAFAGPLSNLTLAALFSFLYKVGFAFVPHWVIGSSTVQFVFGYAITVNLVLAFFNLVPIPPLDGSRIILPFLPVKGQLFLHKIEPYGFLILIALLYFGILDIFLRPLLHLGYRLLLS